MTATRGCSQACTKSTCSTTSNWTLWTILPFSAGCLWRNLDQQRHAALWTHQWKSACWWTFCFNILLSIFSGLHQHCGLWVHSGIALAKLLSHQHGLNYCMGRFTRGHWPAAAHTTNSSCSLPMQTHKHSFFLTFKWLKNMCGIYIHANRYY